MTDNELSTRIETAKQKVRLTWYEEQMMKATKQMISLLRQLRDDPLKPYLATHPSFEAYLQDRHGISARRQQQMLAAEDTRMLLADEAPDLRPVLEKMPEGQMRALVQTPSAQRVEVLREAIVMQGTDKAARGVVPARTIKRAKAKIVEGVIIEATSTRVCPHCGKPI